MNKPLYRIVGSNDKTLRLTSNPKEVVWFRGATAIQKIRVTDQGIKILSHHARDSK